MGKLRMFEIVFDNGKSVYNPSEFVNGKCIVDLRGDMKMKSLRILMRGVAKVHWTESRSTGNRLGAYTEHYNAEIEYFLKKQVLFGSETGDGREVLTEGRHEFHFSFQLPSGGISTSFEGKYGSIRYWLKAEMEKPWTFNHKAKKAFTVICPIDINRSDYLVPVENNMEKLLCCWCCTSGPISLYARTDRKGYCPGESIAITADFENLSSRTIIPHATLHQTQTFLAGGKSRTRHSKYTIVTGLAIQPGRTTSWDAQLLKIPAVTPSIINCCLIRVDYAVRAQNLSSRTIIPHATLHQTQTFLAGGKSRTRHSKYTIVTGLAIQPGRTTSWDAQLLKIPAVTPSIINCCLIRVDYAVRLARDGHVKNFLIKFGMRQQKGLPILPYMISLQIPGACNLSMDLPVLIGTVPLRSSNYRHNMPLVENTDETSDSQMYYQPAPPYSELDTSILPSEPPPTYAECVEGSVDIADEDDDNIIGETRFTPMYTYVHSYQHQPPPAYSEVDPHQGERYNYENEIR